MAFQIYMFRLYAIALQPRTTGHMQVSIRMLVLDIWQTSPGASLPVLRSKINTESNCTPLLRDTCNSLYECFSVTYMTNKIRASLPIRSTINTKGSSQISWLDSPSHPPSTASADLLQTTLFLQTPSKHFIKSSSYTKIVQLQNSRLRLCSE